MTECDFTVKSEVEKRCRFGKVRTVVTAASILFVLVFVVEGREIAFDLTIADVQPDQDINDEQVQK